MEMEVIVAGDGDYLQGIERESSMHNVLFSVTRVIIIIIIILILSYLSLVLSLYRPLSASS